MKLQTLKALGVATAALAFCALASTQASAQAWPAKPIRWVVPYTPAGITDNGTRIVLQKVQEQTGWNFAIENKPGANSLIGAGEVARAPADGYTFLTVIGAHAANATLYAGKIPFDPVKSFAPVSLAMVAPLIMTATNALPAKDLKELIAYAKANPGKISFGSSGIGAAAHLTTEWLKQIASVDMVHVPYKGTAPALQDLMSGNIQILVDTPSSLMPHIKGGKIKALGMFSAQRLASAPEVPTLAEAGGPPMESSTWLLFLAPVGTPRDVVTRLSTEVAKAVNAADVKPKLEGMGIITVGSTPEAAGKFLNDEIAKWAKVIQVAGVKAEQ